MQQDLNSLNLLQFLSARTPSSGRYILPVDHAFVRLGGCLEQTAVQMMKLL